MLADVKQIVENAAKLAADPLWSCSDKELLAALHAAHRLEQAAAVLQVRLVREAAGRGLPKTHGAKTIYGWLRGLLRLDPQPAREFAERVTALAHKPAVERAVLDGRVDLRQAAVIAATVGNLPDTLGEVDSPTTPVSLTETRRITEEAQDKLVELSAQLPAHLLRKAGERILAHVAPELADRADELALERQQARAHKKRHLTLALPVDGLARLSGLLDAEATAILQAALHPLCRPIPDDDRLMPQRRADALVELCNLALRTGSLPADGGEPPQLTIKIDYNSLSAALDLADPNGTGRPPASTSGPTDSTAHPTGSTARPTGTAHPTGSTARPAGSTARPAGGSGQPSDDTGRPSDDTGRPPGDSGQSSDDTFDTATGSSGTGTTSDPAENDGGAVGAADAHHFPPFTLGSGTTDTGQRLSASTIRRLACEARLLPAVLGGEGQILDLGRSRRLATAALRRALHIRDGGCAFPSCDRPPRWTDIHHIVEWSLGGLTSLDNTVLLCRHHHRLLHHPTAGWRVRLGTDRRPEFIPPPTVDPHQVPRRNHYHQRN
ncbi:HNH endonuclease signature motif containing protein [Actinoplanes solisilvae]|uniref:HNH endonuclease signature motif containing protein n=1 Tax=Actinoplanes solisilvae TaxID=2486853 RepID=UPI001F0B943A|nr:HNH endonuclease signature motif containing protein [Actinoplanes solisilvae]